MKGLEFLYLGIAFTSTAVWGLPFIPYSAPHYGDAGQPTPSEQGVSLKLARSIVQTDVHPLIARAQAANRAYKKFAGR
jgi:hypothetical protein